MGIAQLAKIFRQHDRDESQGLSFSEFCDALVEFGANLDSDEMRLLFNSFDTNGDGEVSYREFLKGEHGQLKGHRLRLVRQAFDQLNISGTGTIPIEILEDCYHPTQHPDVLQGRVSGEEAVRQFIGYFDFAVRGLLYVRPYACFLPRILCDVVVLLLARTERLLPSQNSWTTTPTLAQQLPATKILST